MKAQVKYERDEHGLIHFHIDWSANWHLSAGPFAGKEQAESAVHAFLERNNLEEDKE